MIWYNIPFLTSDNPDKPRRWLCRTATDRYPARKIHLARSINLICIENKCYYLKWCALANHHMLQIVSWIC